jgi:putative peptidoglycan lipid II flippase
MADKKASSVKTISLVIVLTLIGKLLGLLRDSLMTTHFGSGMETNAFLTASQLPRVFFDVVFASAVAASFIPVFSETVTKRGKREAIDFSGNFITVIGLLSLVLTVLGMLFTEPLVRLFAAGYDDATMALCVSLARIMFPTVLFTGIAYCFVGILQSMDEFNIPALISVIANLIVIAYYFTFNQKFGIYGLAAAFLIGWFVQAAMQAPSLIRKGFTWKPSLSLRSEGMKKVLALMLPVMVSTWVQPINLTINTNFGSHLYNGTGVTAINLSNNLYLIVVGVFILSVTNVIFPRLSRLTAANETARFNDTLSATVHASMYFVIPMTAGMMVLSRPIVSLIYGWGKFDDFAVAITSQALTFVSLGMIGFALQAVLCRACFARQNGRIPLIAGLASIAVNLALSALLTGPLGVTGLAVASAAAATVNAVLLLIPLQMRGEGFMNRKFAADLLKMTAAALFMAAAVWGLLRLLDGAYPGKLWMAVTAVVPAAVGVLVYFGATSLLRLGEAKSAAAIASRLLTGRNKTDESQ